MEKLLVLLRQFRGQGCEILLAQTHHQKSPGNGIIHFSVFIPKGTVQRQIARYVVRDNGIGMSEEFQKKLFDPFSQEDVANARTQYKGTGLGMAITKKYVDMMGGSIAVESKKGVGSTFTVEIPMELPEQVIQSEQKQHLHRDLTGIHVLMA